MANVHFTHRRGMAVLLCLSMILPLASCKKSKDEKKDLYSAGRVIEATDPYFNAEVNKVKIPTVDGQILDYMTINNCIYTGEYAVVSYSQIYRIPEKLSQQAESSAITGELVDLSSYFVQSTAIFDKEGNFIKDIGETDSNIYGVTVDKDGNIYMLHDRYIPLEIDENMSREEIEARINDDSTPFVIDVFDSAGNPIRTIELSEGIGEYTAYESAFQLLDNGIFALTTAGKIYLYDQQGHLTLTLSDEDREIKGNIVQYNGKTYIVSEKRNLEEGNSLIMKEVDLNSGKLGDGMDLKTLMGYGTVVVSSDGIYANSYSGFFKYDIEKGTIEEVFNWNDSDVDRALMKNVKCTPKSENEILAVGHISYEVDFPYLIHLTRAETNPHAGKKLIVIGGENLSECNDLISFASIYSGKEENSARVVLVDYTEGLRETEGLTDIERSIYLDTLSGAGPDILVNLFDSVAFRSDTIMEDMNQYLDGEKGINRNDYFDNIFRACETNGHLFHIPVRFTLEGLTVNKGLISNTGGWTYDEFFAASETMPDQVSFLEGVLYNELLKLMLGTSLPQFVDYEKRTVDFQNDDMKRILETVKKYGVTKIPDDEGTYYMEKEFPGEGSMSGDGDLTMEKIMEGLLAVWVTNMETPFVVSYWNFLSPSGADFLGYPAKEKNGMAVSPQLSMGIVASSKSKGLAWDFIKAFMDYEVPDYQLPYSMPVRKAEYERESLIVMEQRNNFRDSFESRLEIARYMGAAPMSEEDIATARKIIENATISTGGDPAIFEIICEEAVAYFAGDRTVEEVLKNIQNRATIVVQEM